MDRHPLPHGAAVRRVRVDPMPYEQRVFSSELRGGILTIAPQGDALGFRDSDIDADVTTLRQQIAEQKAPFVIADLSNARYFGSVIIGAINLLGQEAKKAGGEMVLCGASPEMQKMLEITGLLGLWMHFDDYKTALRAGQAARK